MAARKKAEDNDQVQAEEQDEAVADDAQAVEDRADGPIEVSVEGDDAVSATDSEDYVVTEDATGRPVAESFTGEVFSTLDNDVDDPSVPQPTPGGPGDEPVANRVEKNFVLAAVTKPEVTSQNPEPYSVDELNHRFTHIPPEGFVERKFPVKQ